MALLHTLGASLLVLTLATPLQAANVDGRRPDQIVSILQGFGSIENDQSQDGSPRLVGRIDGTRYGVYFYGCDDSRANCNEIQFSAGWSGVEINLAQINVWNSNKRYCRAYIDDEGDPMLELDINLRYGVTSENLADTVEYWQLCLNEFRKELDR